MYSFKNSNLVCLAGNKIMRADIPEIFLLKEYHKYILIKRRGVFSQLKKKWKTKLCFPCPLIQNATQPCRVSDEMFFHARLFIIHKFSETSGEYQYFGDICHLEVVQNWRRNGEVLSCCFFGIVQKFAENIYLIFIDSVQAMVCLHGWS